MEEKKESAKEKGLSNIEKKLLDKCLTDNKELFKTLSKM